MSQLERIDPRDVIAKLTPDDLCQGAESYYSSIEDSVGHLAKPFSGFVEAPELLHKMGILLSGLRLGPGMTVVDFGAGTCWFSRHLAQMGCRVIAVDPSNTALSMGKQLFESHPVIGELTHEPAFLQFDGHQIELDDDTVDRIVCFDVFHHIPNQREVLAEMFRVLRPGGVVGFSEPGPQHSQSAISQYEMRTFTVLENDIHLEEIASTAEALGFGELRIKPVAPTALELDLASYLSVLAEKRPSLLDKMLRRLAGLTRPSESASRYRKAGVDALEASSVFFFTKGTYVPDSRIAAGLLAELELLTDAPLRVSVGQTLTLSVRGTNTGSSTWLAASDASLGSVNCGVHLLQESGKLLDLDFARAGLAANLAPGESAEFHFELELPASGKFRLGIDMVAEQLSWFEVLGSEPLSVSIEVV